MNYNKKKLPYRWYYFFVLFINIAGIIVTSYLAFTHYKNYTDLAYASFCAISKTINCDTVSQSPWSLLLNFPVALWGLTGYTLYLLLLVPAHKNTQETLPLWSILQTLGLFYSIIAIALGYISARIIDAYCLMCIISYGISFSLFLLPVMIKKRFDKKKFAPNLIQIATIFKKNIFIKISVPLLFIFFISFKLILPHYWIYEYPTPSMNINTGITEYGHPWIGSKNPKLIIDEFSDYQCFQCSKLHFFLRHLIAQNPENIRLVHHHYPLDHNYNPILIHEPFHVGSGEMALLAIYATKKGEFWKMNDELYKFSRQGNQKELDLRIFAEKLHFPLEELQTALSSDEFRLNLALDIQKGLQLGITGTPAYLINGKLHQGTIEPDTLREILR